MKWRTGLFALMFWAALFGLAEGASHLWIKHRGNALDITRRVLEMDAELGWRQRPHLSLTFLGLPLETNEEGWRAPPLSELRGRGELTIVLGPSSAFGWGVRKDETYADLLAEKAGQPVLNTGEIGFSSDQGRRLFAREIFAQLRPKVAVIGYGINDLDRYRFYFQSGLPDREELDKARPAGVLRMVNGVMRFDLTAVLFKLANGVRGKISSRPAELPVCADCSIPSVRVPLGHFRANLEAMTDRARALGAAPILLTTVYRPPGAEKAGDRAAARLKFSQGERHWREGQKAEAESALRAAVALAPYSDAFFLLARMKAEEGNAAEAKELLDQAMATELHRLVAEIPAYNKVVRAVARERGAMVGELDEWLGKERDALFVDPVHFSAAGNARIADGLAALIRGAGKK